MKVSLDLNYRVFIYGRASKFVACSEHMFPTIGHGEAHHLRSKWVQTSPKGESIVFTIAYHRGIVAKCITILKGVDAKSCIDAICFPWFDILILQD